MNGVAHPGRRPSVFVQSRMLAQRYANRDRCKILLLQRDRKSQIEFLKDYPADLKEQPRPPTLCHWVYPDE